MTTPPPGTDPPLLHPQQDPRAMPVAYMVRNAGTTPALFLDLGRALAYAAKYNGQLVPLHERT